MDFTQILISFFLFIFTYVKIQVSPICPVPPNSIHLFSSILSFLYPLSEYMFYIYK